jgi:hypothetical protein
VIVSELQEVINAWLVIYSHVQEIDLVLPIVLLVAEILGALSVR